MRVTTLTSIALVSFALSNPASAQNAASGGHGQGHGRHGQMNHGAMESSPDAAKAEFDHQFIDTMIVHHESAIEMAKLAADRAEHDELKQMARKMMNDQQKETQQLQEWKKQWYGDKGDAVNMKMSGMAESMKNMPMEKLEAAKGAAFDAMFIDMMTRHHRGAIKMAEVARQKAKRPEIKKLSQDVMRVQKQEVAEMTKWRKEWKLSGK